MIKVPDTDVLAIRAHYAGPAPHTSFAEYGRALGVGGDTVRRVAIGRLRAAVGGPLVAPDFRPVVQRAPMAAPKNPRGGRPKRVPGEATKPTTLNLTPRERARYEALAARWGVKLADALRRAADEACAREGVRDA